MGKEGEGMNEPSGKENCGTGQTSIVKKDRSVKEKQHMGKPRNDGFPWQGGGKNFQHG